MVSYGIWGIRFTSTIVSTVNSKTQAKKIEKYTTITSRSEEEYSWDIIGEGKCIGWVWLIAFVAGYMVTGRKLHDKGRLYLFSFFLSLDFFTFPPCFFLLFSSSVCIHYLVGYRIVREERGRVERYSFVVSLLLVCYRFV